MEPPASGQAELAGARGVRISVAGMFVTYQAFALLLIHLRKGAMPEGGVEGAAYLAATGVEVLAMGRLLDAVAGRRRWAQAMLLPAFLFVHCLLNAYRRRWLIGLDPTLIIDNLRHIANAEVWGVVASAVTPADLAAALSLALGAAWWCALGPGFHPGRPPRGSRLAGLGLAWLALAWHTPVSGEPLAAIAGRTGRMLLLQDRKVTVSARSGGEGAYPLLRTNNAAVPAAIAPAPRPHILLVAMESFNRLFVDQRVSDTQEYTPVLNRLKERGAWFPLSFSTATTTIRSHEAMLSGLPPALGSELNQMLPALRVRGLPKVLAENGYQTLFFQGHTDISFSRTDEMMRAFGFEVLYSGETLGAGLPPEKTWGWGLQDDCFFRSAFKQMEEDARRRPEAPVFAMMATISHHVPFRVPASERRIHPKPRTQEQMYANSINAADRYLGALLEELAASPRFKDSLVILTGDHGYPDGEHGVHHNMGFPYSELYTVPLLIIWPGRVAPMRHERTVSHLDLAPTILDLLRIQTRNHFVGRSVFDQAADRPGSPFVQRYNGGYAGMVRHPYRYVLHIDSGTEYLFNLRQDPKEGMNLARDAARGPELEVFRKEVAGLLAQDQLLRENRLLPP